MAEKENKENRKSRPEGEGARRRPPMRGKPQGKPRKPQKNAQPAKARSERKGAPAQKEPVISPRRRRMQEQLTAEQKAFAEATDIMLDAAATAAENEEKRAAEKVEIIGVRFRPTGKTYFFSPGGEQLATDEGVIVETARGQEYGTVAFPNRFVNESETVSPLKTIVRRATDTDTARYNANKRLEEKAAGIWDELVAKHGLAMSLTDVEYTFDNSKLIFYFTADGRVDFRDLVKDLASVFRTRIELRQIGVRDEAKLVGGLGVCGMPFCCNRFLPDFVQVSIKMAKEQNLSLSSAKISGNCGRLMCCLRYEQDVYEKEYETFPRPDMVVRTAQGTGVITESNFLNGKIKVQLDNEAGGTPKVFTREEVKVIGRARQRQTEALDSELKKLED